MMTRILLGFMALGLLCSLKVKAQNGETAAAQPAPVVAMAPTLTLKDTRGFNRSLALYRGQVVLVNFWATWCPPCRAEMPDLVKLQRANKARGLQIIGITYPDDNRVAARRLIRQLRINYPIWWGTPEAAQQFDVADVLPVTIVIDRRGRIRERITGMLLPEEFTEKVQPLLAEDR